MRVPLVLILGWSSSFVDASWSRFNIVECSSSLEVLEWLTRRPVDVLVIGEHLEPSEGRQLLSSWNKHPDGRESLNIVMARDPHAGLFQEFINLDQLFYLSRGPLSEQQLLALIIAGTRRLGLLDDRRPVLTDDSQSTSVETNVLTLCKPLFHFFEASHLTEYLAEAIRDLVQADAAECLLYDQPNDVLWSPAQRVDVDLGDSAAAGLIGYSARTRQRVHVREVSQDPRYDPGSDDFGPSNSGSLLIQPVVGVDGTVVALLIAFRRESESRPFSPRDELALEHLATFVHPVLCDARTQTMQTGVERSYMLRHCSDGNGEVAQQLAEPEQDGHPLYTTPTWLNYSHWLIVCSLLVISVFGVFVRVHEYAKGPVLIRASKRNMITASASGSVQSVEVSVGDHVRVGDLLARLVSNIGVPQAPPYGNVFVAPVSGVVNEVRIHEGQQLVGGDQVMSIIDDSARYKVIAFLPGSFAPQLHVGAQLVFKLDGYPDSKQRVSLSFRGSEVIGPREATEYVGKDSSDAFSLSAPTVIYETTLPSRYFQADQSSYLYHDGMVGEGEVSVRSRPIVVELVPGLRELYGQLVK